MNNELLTILNYMEKERGIDREVLIQAVEFALQSAARKSLESTRDLRVEIDRKTCDIRAFATVEVVDSLSPNKDEIGINRAKKLKPGVKPGELMEVEVTPKNFGRIAAQTAKQAIVQKIRQAEKDRVFDEYKDRSGDIVSGSVASSLIVATSSWISAAPRASFHPRIASPPRSIRWAIVCGPSW